jgi:MarR family transcriptional regulator, organic hydroperoxide resistance regulator
MDAVQELRYLILGAQREGARALGELLQATGLTPAQAEVLAVVAEADGPLSVREIGERLVCETGSPSRLVASVADAGLLERGERTGDRRAVELSLTERGKAAVAQVRRAESELHAWLAASLTERELAALVRALRKLVDERPAGNALARRAQRS